MREVQSARGYSGGRQDGPSRAMTALSAPERECLRCLRCSSRDMHRSGREPYRVICGGCGSHYHVVMQLVSVDPAGARASSEANVGDGLRATRGGCLPKESG